MLIITLSSIPPRFSRIGPCLQSLLAQTAEIDGIYLYIPLSYRRFPDWDGALPEVPDGVEIRRCDEDFGPATKVLPAVREFAGRDCDILFGDDDRAYEPGWAADFLRARDRHPGCAIARRGLMADRMVGTTHARALQPRAQPRPEESGCGIPPETAMVASLGPAGGTRAAAIPAFWLYRHVRGMLWRAGAARVF